MKVLMQARPDLLKIPAGDTIQILKTKKALNESGVEVDLNLTLNPDLEDYQLVHCFNILRIKETYTQVVNALQQQRRVLLTPIYWNMREHLQKNIPDKLEWWDNGKEKREKVLDMVDLLLPNAKSEMVQIKTDFKFNTPHQVVYNGVDSSFYESRPDHFIKEYGIKDFVLCVGRICPRKNQLTMIRALKDTDIKMVFIGSINDPVYYRQCVKEGGDQILMIRHLPHHRLSSAYAAAKVHMLASWYDTPGLVNLEAGLSGCNLVVSNRGTAREYFNDLVWYCSPDDPQSIATAVKEAYLSPQIDDLKSRILRNFTWEAIGKATQEIYCKVLNSRYLSRVI